MKKLWLLLVLVGGLGLANTAFAQHSVKGKLVDEQGQAMPSATVMLLNASDSVLKSFALSKADGSFEMKAVKEGSYVLKATFQGYNNLNQAVTVEAEPATLDLGNLTMTEKSVELGDVEITGEMIPVQVKGDTLEYNANAFKTQPNASVEDLLKRLPGMEVESDGAVKAQGETVTKVLVDGKEFFGDDPKVATKNLPADAIDKVQVFDKQSDMADFTGVDDGERTRTINLLLKEDRKNGYFGDVMAGYGTSNRFRAKTNLNRFSDKTQISLLGMANNINEQAFSISDYVNFMGGITNVMGGGGMGRGGGGSSLSMSPGDLGISFGGSTGSSSGISTTAATGLNFNTEIGKKTKVSASYFYNYLRKDLEQYGYTENILTEQSYTTLDTTDQVDKNQNHRVNLRVQHEIDSSSKLIFIGAGKLNSTNSESFTSTQSLRELLEQNYNTRNQTTLGGLQNGAGSLQYLKRFSKMGRSLALQVTGGITNQDKETDITALNVLHPDDTTTIQIPLNQDQGQNQYSVDYGGKITYTEPIGRFKFLEGYFAHQVNANDLTKDFYNVTLVGNEFDSTLSNRYDGGYMYDQAGVSFRYARKNGNLNIGVAGQRSELEGTIGLQDTFINKLFLNVLPSLSWNYSLNKTSRIRFSYRTSVNAPSIDQLSPVVNNSNPLSIYQGNPDLRAEYVHTARFSYNIFDQFSFTGLFLNLSSTYTQNKISSSTTVDSLLRQFTTFVNTDYEWRNSFFAHFNTPIRKLGIKLSVDPNITYTNSITLINGVENPTSRLAPGGNVSIENRKKEKFDVRVGSRQTYNISRYAINPEQNQQYLNSSYYAEATAYLPKGFTLNGEFSYNIYSGASFAQSQTVPLLKAYVAKTFLKAQRGELRLNAFDILNQNRGISRSSDINYIQETRYNTLSRYFLLSFTYKIVAVGK